MHVAPAPLRRWITFTVFWWMSSMVSAHAADRVPLVGTGLPAPLDRPSVVRSGSGQIVPIDTTLMSCPVEATFSDVGGGETPGTKYDGFLVSGGLLFSERFAGQSVSSNGDFDVISGSPSNPLQLQAGAEGQNLDVFDYAGNVLAGLGPVGFPDIDAIGEGSIAIYFTAAQSQVKLSLMGGNGGSATLSFYRRDGSLIDEVVVPDLADLPYAFGTFDGSSSIAGILIQNDDASGIGVDNICYDPDPVPVRPVTWGNLKKIYR